MWNRKIGADAVKGGFQASFFRPRVEETNGMIRPRQQARKARVKPVALTQSGTEPIIGNKVRAQVPRAKEHDPADI